MKSIRSIIIGLGLFTILFILPGGLLAQTAPSISTAKSTPSDSIVQLTAEAQGLSLVSRADLPPFGTYWLVMTRGAAPLPCPPLDQSLPIYAITDGQFIVDGTGSQATSTNDLMLEAATVVNLINQAQNVQSRRMARTMTLDGPPSPGDGSGGGDYTNSFYNNYSIEIDTNQLWLDLTNVSSGRAYANLHHATNSVYAIWWTTDLSVPFANWQVATELWPVDTNCQPFTVLTQGWPELFLRAEDWTGVDSDGDGIPDWWIWQYFGDLSETATNMDASGNSLGYDYSNNIPPTVYQFTGVEVTNNYVVTSSATVQLDVSGRPYYVAVSVDDTNYASDSVWNEYASSNVTVNLGLTEGWHDVWIGLRGHGDDPTNAVWQWTRLKLDYTPPAIVITGPTNGTVAVPMIQLTGYTPEALASISYDLSNAAGTMTNQPVLVEGRSYDTNSWEFTTNQFQAYDIRLADGTNTFTLHATDLAGNSASLSTNIIFQAGTNPPVVSLLWPQAGMQMSGTNFTLEGRVNAPTATVSIAMVDGAGNTNVMGGRVGRDGIFWVENVPLNVGTNDLTITVSNAMGNITTNFTLLSSGVNLTVNAVSAGDTLVNGSITNGYTVWVNGNQATNNGDDTWTAQITPLCVGGGLVQVTAIPNSDNGGNGSGGAGAANPQSAQSLNTQATVQPPQGVFTDSYHVRYHLGSTWEVPLFSSNEWTTLGWQNGSGGTANDGDDGTLLNTYSWPANQWPTPLPEGTNRVWLFTGQTNGYWETNIVGGPGLKQEHCDIGWAANQQQGGRTADTEVKLATGGPLGSTQMNLWVISASATAYTNISDTVGTNVPYDQISIGSFGNLDTNGNLYVVLPDNDPPDITAHANGKNYTFSVGATEFHPYIKVNGVDLDYDTPTFCVGQPVTFSVGWSPSTPDFITNAVVIWSLPGTFVNTNSDPNCDRYYSEDALQLNRIKSGNPALSISDWNTLSTSCWYVKDLQGKSVSLAMNLTLTDGRQFVLTTAGQFNVFRPSMTFSKYQDGTPTVMVTNDFLSLGWNRDRDMSFGHTISLDNIPNNLSGQAGYVQLVSGSYTDIKLFGNTVDIGGGTPDTELDTGEFPRGEPSIAANTNNLVVFWDGPYDALYHGNAQESLNFSTYLMFKPSGGIWVPLRLVTWTLKDEAANGAVFFNIGDGVGTGPSDNDCTSFPDWKNIWTP